MDIKVTMNKIIVKVPRISVLFLFFFFPISNACSPNLFTDNALKNDSCEMVLCTWNIGHFSNGKNPRSLIDGSNYESKVNGLMRILYDSIRADVLCVNEYSKVLGVDSKKKEQLTASVLMQQYKIQKEGKQVGFSSNSIFSNVKVRNIKECSFACTQTYVKDTPRAANYYYLAADLYIKHRKVKLICAHTISGAPTICQAQIAELINKYAKFERVIMCGDWNTTDYSSFVKAGYTLANKGGIPTFHSKQTPIDNIIVKGLNVSFAKSLRTNLSDHYPLLCRISVNR